MAAPIVGKVDFKTTDGATILTVDSDSSFVQVRMVTKSGTVKVMEITNTGSLSLYDEGARLDGMIASLIMGANGSTHGLFPGRLQEGRRDHQRRNG